MGTPVFAAPVLEAVVSAGHEVAAVYSRPDRPSGRGKRTSPTPRCTGRISGARS